MLLLRLNLGFQRRHMRPSNSWINGSVLSYSLQVTNNAYVHEFEYKDV